MREGEGNKPSIKLGFVPADVLVVIELVVDFARFPCHPAMKA
jgi:hypothetical protein